MARPRRRARDRRSELDNPRTRMRLMEGHDFDFFGGPELGEDELAAAWEELGEQYVAEWIAGYTCSDFSHEPAPGSRPWGWWRFEAPEPRRQIDPDAPGAIGPPIWFGMASAYSGGIPEYETSAAYLRRLNLLTPEERRLDAAGMLDRKRNRPSTAERK